MKKNITRLLRQRLKTENKQWPKNFVEIPEKDWPFKTPNLINVYRSRDYLVQKYKEGEIIRLSMNRTSMKTDGNWNENLQWEEIQNIKRELGFGDFYAIEIYPRDHDIVNVANMRHLWIMPKPLPIGWFRK